MKIGLLGGTFNPVHYGHLHIAEEVFTCCGLDQVWFVPTCQPPHKRLVDEVSFQHRSAMVAAALADDPRFMVCDIEGRRGGTSYSVETLEQLHHEYPQHQFFFIMGLDSFQEIGSWKDYPRLFELAHLVVTARPGFSGSLQALLPVAIADRFCYDAESKNLLQTGGFSVFSVTHTCRDISSTDIRRKLMAGEDVSSLIPDAVSDYIRQHKLYQNSKDPVR
ncbi:MAG: nicotinate-nucleotide adenylyltransferase [Deltaproteobacteria bacterium]|nr:nicotinate-nucleotide adenylyltransferase [Deltaproteobacteria bacterium]